MQKPASLRAALEARIEGLRSNPDRMAIWVEDGRVRARSTGDLSFLFEYPLSILLRDVATDLAIVSLAIIRWLGVNQPDLLAAGQGDSFTFEADILDNKKADILITLQLTEQVRVTPIDTGPDAGGFDVDYIAEPDPLFEDDGEVADGAGSPPIAGHSVDTIVADD